MQSAETKAFHLNVFLNKCLRKHQGGEPAPVERSVGVVGVLGRVLNLWKTRASPQLRLFAEVEQAVVKSLLLFLSLSLFFSSLKGED